MDEIFKRTRPAGNSFVQVFEVFPNDDGTTTIAIDLDGFDNNASWDLSPDDVTALCAALKEHRGRGREMSQTIHQSPQPAHLRGGMRISAEMAEGFKKDGIPDETALAIGRQLLDAGVNAWQKGCVIELRVDVRADPRLWEDPMPDASA